VPPDDNKEYDYWPRPALLPPLSSELLREYFSATPDEIDPNHKWIFERMPKRIYLSPSSGKIEWLTYGETTSWGIFIEDGIDMTVLLSMAVAWFVLCIFFGSVGYITHSSGIEHIISLYMMAGSVLLSCLLTFYLERAATDKTRQLTQTIRCAYFLWRRLLAATIPWFGVEQIAQPGPLSVFSQHQSLSGNNLVQQTTGQNASNDTGTGAGSGQINGTSGSVSERSAPGTGSDKGGGSTGRGGNGGGNEGGDGSGSLAAENDDREAAELYLHIILTDGVSGKKQIPVKVTEFTNDYELFQELNRRYRQHRGGWRALFMIRSVRPTKYDLFDRTHVRTYFDPTDLASTMPDLTNRPPEYLFSYRPAHVIPQAPLLHEAQLTRLYHSPRSSIHRNASGDEVYDQQCYERSPKRKGRLIYKPNGGIPSGYAFEFVECFDIKFILTCELLIACLAFVLGGLYWGFAKDDQKTSTASNIAMFVFVFGQFLYGVILALGEKMEAWRFY
jgi:hypothetical protein